MKRSTMDTLFSRCLLTMSCMLLFIGILTFVSSKRRRLVDKTVCWPVADDILLSVVGGSE